MSIPIRPEEVADHKVKSFPPFVFAAFNDCIAAEYEHSRARVLVKNVIKHMKELANEVADLQEPFAPTKEPVTEFMIRQRGWLNVEDSYRKFGWNVSYNQAAYNESNFDAYFLFERRPST